MKKTPTKKSKPKVEMVSVPKRQLRIILDAADKGVNHEKIFGEHANADWFQREISRMRRAININRAIVAQERGEK